MLAQRSHVIFGGKAERLHVALRSHIVLTFGGGLVEICGTQHGFACAGRAAADGVMIWMLVCAGGCSDG